MQRSVSVLVATSAAIVGVHWGTAAQVQNVAAGYSVAKPVVFHPGNDKVRDKLARIADAREIVQDRFAIALLDLNDDGRAEIILQSQSSAFCGSGGCQTLVIEQQGQRMVTLLTQNLDSSLAITQERVGAYRALAVLDASGSIAVADKPGTPLHGRQMVYPVGQARAAAEPVNASVRTSSAPAGSNAPSVVGIRIGMPVAEAEALLKKHADRYAGKMSVTPRTPLRPQCGGCTGPNFDASLGAYRNGNLTGEERDDNINLLLSPPSAGAKVIAVTRRLLLKNAVTREAMLQQFRERHGKEAVLDASAAIWFLDDNGRAGPLPRTTRFPPGESPAYACAAYPGKDSGYDTLINNAEALRARGAFGRVNVDCGSVLSVETSGDMVQQITVVLVDHKAVIAAATAAADDFLAQRKAGEAKARADAQARPAPKLN